MPEVPSVTGHRIRRVRDGQHAPWDRRDLRNRPPSGVETLEPFTGVASARRPSPTLARMTMLGWGLALSMAVVAAILLLNLR